MVYERSQHPDEPRTSLRTFSTFLGAAYGSIQMLILHTPHYEGNVNPYLQAGRWLGAATLVSTTFLLFWNRLRHEFRLVRLSRWSEHHVVCGLGQKGMAIVESIRRGNKHARIVVIDPDPVPHFVEQCDSLGVSVIRRDATDRKSLDMARVATAGEIIAVTVADETNIRIAAELRGSRKTAAAAHAFCRVHIANSYLPGALQKWTDATADIHTTLRFFDVFDNEARRVLLNLPADGQDDPLPLGNFAPIDGAGIGPADERSVHVVILGMGRMGSALGARSVKMGHFANGKPLRLSVIDRNADRQRDQFLFHHPILGDHNEVCDLKLHQHHADSRGARQLLEQFAAETDSLLHVFVCLDSDARSAEVGLRLWEVIEAHPGAYMNIRIKSQASLAPILQSSIARIRTFGMLEDTCTTETFRSEQNEAIAEAIHKEFVAARKAGDPSRINDPALAEWSQLRDDFRESNRQQADHMAIKMRAIGCAIVAASAPGDAVTVFPRDEVESLAELEHRRWNAERLLSGWRHGTKTDKQRRIHENLVAWDLVPDNVQEYDREAIKNIPWLLAKVSPKMKVVRRGGANKA
jgi:hypothetical protein